MILVSGNRSGDLDSLITSYAACKLLRFKANEGEVYPLKYFADSQWKLHRDGLFLLESCGADVREFLDSADLPDLARRGISEILLTDHNRPEEELLPYRDLITSVTDHHEFKGSRNKAIHYTLDNTGSCSTLVAEELLKIGGKMDKSIAEMLYFTIRCDTDHLPETGHYNLARDRKALADLLPLVEKNESFLDELLAQRENFEGFTSIDYLERDFKTWRVNNHQYGISTIPLEPDSFFRMIDEEPSVPEDFMKKNDLSVLFLIHFLKKPILKRELTVLLSRSYSPIGNLMKGINLSGLFDEPLEVSTSAGVFYRFHQKDPNLSRKIIQPLLNSLLEKSLEDKS